MHFHDKGNSNAENGVALDQTSLQVKNHDAVQKSADEADAALAEIAEPLVHEQEQSLPILQDHSPEDLHDPEDRSYDTQYASDQRKDIEDRMCASDLKLSIKNLELFL